MKHKIDAYATNIPNFGVLLLQARKIMIEREDGLDTADPSQRTRSSTMISGGADTVPVADSNKSPGQTLHQ